MWESICIGKSNMVKAEPQMRSGFEDNSDMIFLVSQ